MAILINGDGYAPVTAQQDADLYAGILGNDLVVLNVGSKMAATIQNATTVRIADGEAVVQGRRIHINVGTYDDFTIPDGTQGVETRYCIGYHIYQDSSNNELCETFVEPYSSALITPAVIRDGNTESYITMYIVTQSGVNMTGVEPVFDISGNVCRTKMEKIHDRINATVIDTTRRYTSIPELADWDMVCVYFNVHNVRQPLYFMRPVNMDGILADRPSKDVYVRGSVTVDWENNRIGIMCPNATSVTLSTVYRASIYGVA